MVKTEGNDHLTEEQLKYLKTADLSDPGLRGMLEHMADCTFCADRFAGILTENLVPAPAYLKEEILEKTRSVKMQTVKAARRASKRTRLFLYSLRVGFALTASLCLLFLQVNIRTEPAGIIRGRPPLMETVKRKGALAAEDFLKNISIRLPDMEYEEVEND